MKHQLSLITILFIFPLFLKAQSDTTHIASDYNRQIGIDVTTLLDQFLNFTSSSTFEEPIYFLQLKRRNNNKVIRIGIGGTFEIDGEGDSTDQDYLLNFRLGSERQVNFAKRWRVSYGWDAKLNFLYRATGGSENNNLQIGLGASPVFGIEYFINKRLSLATEAGYNLFLVYKDRFGETSLGALGHLSVPKAIVMNFLF